ncbi:MAG: phosphotransferase [Pseudomonadota bacterium]
MKKAAQDWLVRQDQAWTSCTLEVLKAEASFRTFYRVRGHRVRGSKDAGNPTTAVLMISPPDKEQNDQFEKLADVFGSAGIPVPKVLTQDRKQGFYLLTDLGERELAESYGTDAETAGLTRALEVLLDLQAVEDPAIPPYTAGRFRDELGIFEDWFVGRLLGLELPSSVARPFAALVARTQEQPQCAVHRDYHCRNLLYDPTTERFGVVDFQDALRGPVSYDLASLLHDCYHRFPEETVAHWRAWYLEHTPEALDPEVFHRDLDYAAIQRQLKAVGIFSRLKLRDGKTTHLAHILPTLDQTRALLDRQGDLAPLADWLGTLDPDFIEDKLQL